MEEKGHKKGTIAEEANTVPVYNRFSPQMTLPQFLGYAMERVMTDKAQLDTVLRELQVWYDPQPLEDRREIARQIRREMELSRNVPQAIYVSFSKMAMADL
jgi:hypothetical protein